MTRHARPALAVVALVLALAGCAQSSNATTSATSGPGAAPTASTPTASTPTASTPPASSTTGSGTSAPPSSTNGLSVTPAVGSSRSVIQLAVTPTYRGGAPNNEDISNALSVMGPQKAGCVGIHQQGLAALPAGQTTTVSLGPAQLGGNWCPGTYTARVEVLERPKCGAGQMCPQFIRVLASFGPVSFRISG